MKLYTATVNYLGPEKVDVTAKSATEDGKIFAPTWKLVHKFKEGTIDWQKFEELYREEIEESWNKNRENWEIFLKRENAVICCYCNNKMCHRYILVDILREKSGLIGVEFEYVMELDF